MRKFPFFFFSDPTTTEIYTLSLHDALPISPLNNGHYSPVASGGVASVRTGSSSRPEADRKSTRLNSSHTVISYAVFCLKKNTQPENMRSSLYPTLGSAV